MDNLLAKYIDVNPTVASDIRIVHVKIVYEIIIHFLIYYTENIQVCMQNT